MGYIHEGYQGEIAKAKRKKGQEQEVHVYKNSSDFPEFNIISLVASGEFTTERVPINEDIWRAIGKCLGYRFVIRKKKGGQKQ